MALKPKRAAMVLLLFVSCVAFLIFTLSSETGRDLWVVLAAVINVGMIIYLFVLSIKRLFHRQRQKDSASQ